MLRVLADMALVDEIVDGTLEAGPREELAQPLVRRHDAGVAPHRAVMECRDELGLKSSVGADPEPVSLVDDALPECSSLVVRALDRKLHQEFLRCCIRFIRISHLM